MSISFLKSVTFRTLEDQKYLKHLMKLIKIYEGLLILCKDVFMFDVVLRRL